MTQILRSGIAAVALVALVGCSSSSPTAEPAPSPTTEAAATAFCDAAFAVQAAVDDNNPKQALAAFTEAGASAPQELEGFLPVLQEGLQRPDGEEAPEGFVEALTGVSEWVAANCDVQVLDVAVQSDGKFQDPPTTATPGNTVLRITSDRTEVSGVSLSRKKDSETDSAAELAELPMKEFENRLAFVGSWGPGQAALLILAPGDYALLSIDRSGAQDAADLVVE